VNVFLIPSWYPNRNDPLSGIFLQDQALALAHLRPQWNVAVSLWRQGEGTFWLTSPRSWPRVLGATIFDRAPPRRGLKRNLIEYSSPALLWAEPLFGGNRPAIVKANRANMERALAELGSIDLIHAHVSYPAGWAAMRLSEATGIPFIITEHMGPFPFVWLREQDGSPRPIVRNPLERAAARVAVSPALAADMRAVGIQDVEVVPDVVDETFFTPPEPPRGERFTFFTLAQLEPGKGIPDLLHALRRFLDTLSPERHSQVELRIGGAGTQRGRYEAIARQLELEPVVHWLGFLPRDRARDEFRSCDCFVLASRHESFGLVYAEATACGRPLIATRCGGPESIVTPENGLLVDVGDQGGLAEALRRMLESARLYDPETIRRQFLERFSRSAVAEKLEQVYRRVVADSPHPGVPASRS
jgi:glycosyltransferase involved in cell wall biosynthesis